MSIRDLFEASLDDASAGVRIVLVSLVDDDGADIFLDIDEEVGMEGAESTIESLSDLKISSVGLSPSTFENKLFCTFITFRFQ